MEHKRGAFKVNCVRIVRAVKETGQLDSRGYARQKSNDQNSCKKFSQIAAFA
jgi:hypothetical protein